MSSTIAQARSTPPSNNPGGLDAAAYKKIVKTAAVLLLSSLVAQAAAPPRSVWIADYSQDEIAAAVASGKTTLIYSGDLEGGGSNSISARGGTSFGWWDS